MAIGGWASARNIRLRASRVIILGLAAFADIAMVRSTTGYPPNLKRASRVPRQLTVRVEGWRPMALLCRNQR